MSGNTEPTSNSVKFAPMPMSALLANLMPLTQSQSPDDSYTSADDSDDSTGLTVAPKSSPLKPAKKEISTPSCNPTRPKESKACSSEKKVSLNEHNKENSDPSNQTYPNKQSIISNSAQRITITNPYPSSEIKKRCALTTHYNNPRVTPSSISYAVKKTPEMKPPSSTNKMKTGTPKIKSGIRKFTPGSAKNSNKKMPAQNIMQNRDKVRCELFTKKDDPDNKPDNVQCVPPAPETPVNRKPMPTSYAATPSYPQVPMAGNHKVLFKTTNIKDKKYMFIKKLGVGGSSEVYKVGEYVYSWIDFRTNRLIVGDSFVVGVNVTLHIFFRCLKNTKILFYLLNTMMPYGNQYFL